jgi:beta-phosphoglucomutase-like phosphatase (HAD superfamily)
MARECKGVLLNFEDAAGKVWSQSVKEKRLHTRDTIGFHRSAGTRQCDWSCGGGGERKWLAEVCAAAGGDRR